MDTTGYLMESEEEAFRLDVKTNVKAVESQALWAGLTPGMRVADLGCGSGKTTSILRNLAQPGGNAVGVDFSPQRIDYAMNHYSGKHIEFRCMDVRKPLDELGSFDFVWMRFVLEYYASSSFELVQNISRIVKPGGIICLIDLDHNSLSHYGLSERLEKTLQDAMNFMSARTDFDPYAGRKLYSFLYDLGCRDIDVSMSAHHLIFGDLKDSDAFNWMKKIEVVSKKVNYKFQRYPGGFEEFLAEFQSFFTHPRRFSYTPVICCYGRKPGI
jgi:ubiquinone/menaquinone biosynthesis C-methylase UbiE